MSIWRGRPSFASGPRAAEFVGGMSAERCETCVYWLERGKIGGARMGECQLDGYLTIAHDFLCELYHNRATGKPGPIKRSGEPSTEKD